MGKFIAIAGKGGVGKTTFSGLLVSELIRRGLGPVFAVDADANSNLNEVLGVEVERTIGSVREEAAKAIGANALPVSMPKETFLEMKMEEALIESEGFDLLVMGRPEGPGCYCYANNLLRKHVDVLAKNYPFVVIDNEAGMEHLSRRTTMTMDYLFLVSDPGPVGILTARRIRDLASELGLKVDKVGLVLGRVSGEPSQQARELIKEKDLDLVGWVPLDDAVLEAAFAGESVMDLPADSAAVAAVAAIVDASGICD